MTRLLQFFASFFTLVCSLWLCSCSVFAADKVKISSLDKLFEIEQTVKVYRNLMTQLEQQDAKKIEQETDEKKKIKRRQLHEKVAQFLQQKFAWNKVKPLAIQAYQKTYSEDEIQALLRYYATPTGKLTVRKLNPAIEQAQVIILAYMDERIDKIIESIDETEGEPATVATWVPANAGERAAGELARLRFKDDFDERMQQIEQKMLESMMLLLPESESAKTKADAARYGKHLRAHLTFDSLIPFFVREVSNALTQEELESLLNDERDPVRREQLRKNRELNQTMEHILMEWMQKEIMPELLRLTLAS